MQTVRYLGGRVLQGLAVVWAAFTVTFIILYLLPSDPVEIMLSQGGDSVGIDPEAEAALRREHGLDRPVIQQYLMALTRAVQGDFGDSITLGEPVSRIALGALPQTMLLAGVAGFIAVSLGLAIAVAAVLMRSPWLRATIENIPSLTVALPTFWVGILLIQVFSFKLRILPALGNDGVASLVLPALALALPTAGVVAQVLLNNLRATLELPFVTVLAAKGVSRSAIVWRHVLRVAAIPATTIVGMNVAAMLAGAIVVETVFARSGLGRLTETAVSEQDIPLVQGVVVVSAVVFVLANLVVDLLYPLIDPRVTRRAAHQGA